MFKQIFVFVIAFMISFSMTIGCCHQVPVSRIGMLPINPDPNNFVKSTVMLSVEGKVIENDVIVDTTGIVASGVAVNKKHILTAAHFCEPIVKGQSKSGIPVDEGVKIVFNKTMKMTYLNNNEELSTIDGAKILVFDKQKDLCLVELVRHGIVPVPIADPSSIKRGDKVYIVGAPMGVFPLKTEGEVSIPFFRLENKDADHLIGRIIVTAPATNGNSGGPVFNERGEVIGVVMAGAPNYSHLTILTPSKMINNFLKSFYNKKK